ncbi:uncharacterized protein KY384_005696 [Bacidia gigantensis]|uniref:uncharacterized protein n=1 Tax=Bacidia gigantensis TaxID=2732470 RepID=UPI001D03CB9A|nr:uncharacterized protein KY384_005696 [Bacidia gigantensis]KAG8529061.1 hypothetical protein KY384_005696 [Bacidia gigantensis]
MVDAFAPERADLDNSLLSVDMGRGCAAHVEVDFYEIPDERTRCWPFYFYIQDKMCAMFVAAELKECSNHHIKCPRQDVCLMPKRVLSIGSGDTDKIRIHPSPSQYGTYAALSHCWGQQQPLKVTTANFTQMRDNVPWESLNLVFQDAIRICRELGLQYIWIDSLCILQDDTEDWERESSNMGAYYENAYVTIAADASRDGTVPLLSARDEMWLPSKFVLDLPQCQKVDVIARRDALSSPNNSRGNSGPLASRAWAFQEALLSRRTLHITRAELIWECRSVVRAEDGLKPFQRHSIGLPQQLLECESTSEPHKIWHDIVAEFSSRQLTYDTDRLPALSGAARNFKPLLKSEYVAGLWEKNLIMDLCWVNPLSGPGLATCKADYIAPSWSWASIKSAEYRVDKTGQYPFTSLATVEDIKCEIAGLNPYGHVTKGCLELRALLSNVEINCPEPTEAWKYSLGKDPERVFHPDCILTQSSGSIQRAGATDRLLPFSQPLPCILLGYEQGNDSKKNGTSHVALAPTKDATLDSHSESSTLSPSPDQLYDTRFYVMVLGIIDTSTYSRLGLAHLSDNRWFESAIEQVVRIV